MTITVSLGSINVSKCGLNSISPDAFTTEMTIRLKSWWILESFNATWVYFDSSGIKSSSIWMPCFFWDNAALRKLLTLGF